MKKNMEPRGISFFLSDAGGIFDLNCICVFVDACVFRFRSCDDYDDNGFRFRHCHSFIDRGGSRRERFRDDYFVRSYGDDDDGKIHQGRSKICIGRTLSTKPIFFGGSAVASPLAPDICSLLLPPPTPTGPSSYFRPRHRGDAALLAGCHDDDNDEDEDDDDETNREGSGGERDDDAALEGDEKPDDVRQPASRATQVATIGYLMIILMSPL